MAAKKSTRRKRPGAAGAGDAAHGFTVLMEEMASQNRATIEAVQALSQRIDKRFEEAEVRGDRRFQSLEAAVRMSSKGLQRLTEATESLSAQMHALIGRVDRIEQVLSMRAEPSSASDLEARIRRIEERLGLV